MFSVSLRKKTGYFHVIANLPREVVVKISANVMSILTSPPVSGGISLNNSKYLLGDIKINAPATRIVLRVTYLSTEFLVVHTLLKSLLSGVVYINFITRRLLGNLKLFTLGWMKRFQTIK